MTNLEWFKSLTAEQFAKELFLSYINDCDKCPVDKYNHKKCYEEDKDYGCTYLITKWLNKKVDKYKLED